MQGLLSKTDTVEDSLCRAIARASCGEIIIAAGAVARLSSFLFRVLTQVWCRPLRLDRHIKQKTIELIDVLGILRVNVIKKQYVCCYLIESENLGCFLTFGVAPNLSQSPI
jgi:hypothetical protein